MRSTFFVGEIVELGLLARARWCAHPLMARHWRLTAVIFHGPTQFCYQMMLKRLLFGKICSGSSYESVCPNLSLRWTTMFLCKDGLAHGALSVFDRPTMLADLALTQNSARANVFPRWAPSLGKL